jgi:receptor protein-tyrosine kinase
MSQEEFHSSLFPTDLDLDISATSRNPIKRSIGEILVDAGVISKDDALRVISLQREEKIRFGEAAIKLKLISEGDIRYALSYQYEYAYLPRSSGKVTHPELVAAYAPFSHEVDQLRSIRSQLKLRWFDKARDQGMLAVMGADNGNDASYLAANLAIVFAQMGESILLLDSDMRAPRQHSLFNFNNQLGFSSLLAGRSDVASALHTVQFLPKLQVITAGPTPPNPLELLNRANLIELFQWAGKNFDIVIIDTSAASEGADAMIIADKAGAAMTVARANATTLATYKKMVEEIKRTNINLVGSVLNDPPLIDVAA